MPSRRLGVLPPLRSRAYLRRSATELPFPLGTPGCRLFPEAGQALLHGVRALGLRDGDEVLAPAWLHGPTVEALVAAGLVPRFHEVGPRLEPDPADLQALLGPRVRALCLAHHLGFPQDVPGWLAWCRSRGLLLLEDATQAWLGTLGGRPLGSFGDLGGFSLQDLVGLRAGALVMSEPPDRAPAGRSAPVRRRQAFLLRRLLGSDPRARRRANYRTLLAELGEQVPEPFLRLPEGVAPFVLPVESDEQPALLRRLEWHGVGALDFRAGLRPGQPVGRFPNATRLATRTVGLPVHQELRPQDLARIVAATRTGGRAPAELSLEVGHELAPLRALWTKLAERSRNVFNTWEWASVWWRHFGQDRPLRVTVVRRGAEPVGLLPLYQWRSGPARVLRFLGHGPGDQLGPVGDPDDGVPLARALRRSLHRLDADLLLAEQLPRGQDWHALLGGRRLAEEASPIVQFGTDGWEEYLRGRSANFREQVRRRARKLAREHRVAYRLSDGWRDLDRDLDTLFRLHAARWSTAPTNFLADAAFHRAFAPVAVEQGWLRLWFLDVDGEPVAALYGFRFAGTESYYQAGRSPGWNDYRVGFVLLAHAIRQAADDGVGEYRLLRGGEDYKLRFATADPGLETVAVSRGPLAGAALPALAALRAAPGPLGGIARRVGTGALSR
jgi:dTDP-4-amino-4,6-dideoxygalactose transaminase/CelD/BcsL family acetyltransferase involved in cellulose biosynthesis